MTSESVEDLLPRARGGDRDALEGVVRAIQDDVYGLAIRMLWHPQDAEDASQVILVKIVTRLASFRGESSFRTWACRIATNHLLNTRKSRLEKMELTFSAFARDLEAGLAKAPADAPDRRLLEEEVKIGCTHAMLQCLDRDDRMAYILGCVFGVSGEDGARIMDLSPATFRKRLSRSREKIREFMEGHCGLVNPDARCRCARRIAPAIRAGRVDPKNLMFAGRTGGHSGIRRPIEEMEELHRTAAIISGHPDPPAPETLVRRIRETLEGGRYSILDG